MRLLLLATLFFTTLFGYQNVDVGDIETLKNEGVVLVDVRTEGEWQETGVIPSSQRVTSHDYTGKFDVDKFVKTLNEKGIDSLTKVLIICRSGNRSIDASRALEQRGFEHVYNLKNGIKSYIRTGKPLEKVY